MATKDKPLTQAVSIWYQPSAEMLCGWEVKAAMHIPLRELDVQGVTQS